MIETQFHSKWTYYCIYLCILFCLFPFPRNQANIDLSMSSSTTDSDANDSQSKIRGVNLGGWLLLEPWITPSLFQAAEGSVDEWTLTAQLGKVQALALLEPHWRNFISEDDLRTVYNNGITHLRIPFGYWMIDIGENEPFVSGQLPYLKRVIDWANKIGLKVFLDLHGAPGGQNGFDNSGRRDVIEWATPRANANISEASLPESVNLENYPNVSRTLRILGAITDLFSKPEWDSCITGICVMNEPLYSLPINVVKAFYYKSYDLIRSRKPNWTIILSDAFRLHEFKDFMPPSAYPNVILDTHIYHVFDPYLLGLNEDDHCSHPWNIDVPRLQEPALPVMVGEWSLATTDCAYWLNGVGRGTRWEGTFASDRRFGSCTGNAGNNETEFTAEYKQFLTRFANCQQSAYSVRSGWVFWTLKTEGAPQWDYLRGLQGGWMPRWK